MRGAGSPEVALPCRRPLRPRFGHGAVTGKAVAASITGVRTTITTIRASKTGAVAFTPETKAALEDAVFGSFRVAPSEPRALLSDRISRSRLPG